MIKVLKNDERLPVYQRLADQIREEIVTGHWKPGDRLPSENLIAKEYAIAPGTVRQGLVQLVNEGLLERIHGKGTFVRRPNFDQSLFRFFKFKSSSAEIMIPESRILTRIEKVLPNKIARKLDRPEGSKAIMMSRLRLIENQPVLAEEIWLPLPKFEHFLDIPTEELGPLLYPIYDAKCGQLISRVHEELTASIVQPEIGRLLKLNPGSAVIIIERLAKGLDGGSLEWRRTVGGAKRFVYNSEIY